MDLTTLDVALAQVSALLAAQTAEQPTPGIDGDSCMFKFMPADAYHADRSALSCSLLKPLLISPAHFQAALVANETRSDARDFGTLVHLLVLQPELASQELAVFPGVAGRHSGWSTFAALHPDKLVVDEPTFTQGRRLAHKVLETRYKGRPLRDFVEESIAEATVYFTEPATGLRMRIRLDAYHPDISFDLKTSRFALPRAFGKDAVDRHYDLQAYMYSLGRCMYEGRQSAKPFVFIVAENEAPHSVSTLEAGSTFVENGSNKFQACAATFKACTEAGYWPDLGSDGTLEIDPWQQFVATGGWRESLAPGLAA